MSAPICGAPGGTKCNRNCSGCIYELREKPTNKEYKMKDKISVKVSDLKKTYEDECDDVKRVLKKMYPDVFKEKHCCEWMVDRIEDKYIAFNKGVNPLFNYFFNGKLVEFPETGITCCPRCGKKL